MLNDFKCRYGPHSQDLVCTFQGLHHHILRKVLRHTLPYQQQSAYQREGQQYTGGDANQIGKKVSHIVLRFSSQATDKGHTGSIAAGCRNKHHKDNDQHLRKIAQSAFTRVVLQIGVGHKTDNGIEGQSGFHSLNPIGIQEGETLNPENDVADGDHHSVGANQSHGVLFPVHTLVGIYPAQLINCPVYSIKYRVGKGVFSCGNMIKIPPHRNDKDQI